MTAAEPAAPTRERILATARRLFHARTYAEVGINTLCDQAGVVKGSFYHFFPSKQALLDAVMAREKDWVLGEMAGTGKGQGDGRSRVLAQFEAFLKTASAQKNDSGHILGCPVGSLASELAPSNEAARSAASATLLEWVRLLEAEVRAGINDGSIVHTVDAHRTALSLLAVIQGLSTLGRTFNDPDQLTDIAKTCVKRLLPVPANDRR